MKRSIASKGNATKINNKNDAIKNLLIQKLKQIRIFLVQKIEHNKRPFRAKRRNKTITNIVESSKINTKKYYDYDDIQYRGIRDVKDIYHNIDEDYYKPIRVNAFSSNYIEYESNGDKR